MQEERAFLTSLSVYVFYAIISNIKRRKHDALFWIIIGSFAVLHIIALSLVKFPPFNGPSLAVAAPFMFIDGFAMWGILKWFEKHSFVDRRD